ncbi:C40 family peptidase [Paenibacillus sp. GYB003]|uniref:C40 family peptidase n=1 Tax=Paenibacillus sp. GYB003 TaxID=2994392 RepID=UPI002F96231A
MNKSARIWAISLLAASLAVTSGCGGAGGGLFRQSRQSAPGDDTTTRSGAPHPGALSGSGPELLNADEGRIPIVTLDGKPYISGPKLAELLEFQTAWDAAAGKLSMGDTDAVMELTGGSAQAVKEGDAVTLPDAPKVAEGILYIPVAVLPDLFHDDIRYEQRSGELALLPGPEAADRPLMDEPADPETSADELSFADDPNDPFKAADTPASLLIADGGGAGPDSPYGGYADAIPALKQIDMNKVISTAQRYIGVKYVFGAEPYPQSGVFDCSTFSQYVYGKFGITLPRTARAQARQGTSVSRKMLRKGDLMFFYVPGRFKSNKTVGHVGIYMGGGNMIHASTKPQNGVQITSINKPFWKKTFLAAKRVGP